MQQGFVRLYCFTAGYLLFIAKYIILTIFLTHEQMLVPAKGECRCQRLSCERCQQGSGSLRCQRQSDASGGYY